MPKVTAGTPTNRHEKEVLQFDYFPVSHNPVVNCYLLLELPATLGKRFSLVFQKTLQQISLKT